MYVHSQPLSIGTTEWVDDSDSQSKNKPVQRNHNKAKEDENQTSNAPCSRWLQT